MAIGKKNIKLSTSNGKNENFTQIFFFVSKNFILDTQQAQPRFTNDDDDDDDCSNLNEYIWQ